MPEFTNDVAWVPVLPSLNGFLPAMRAATGAAAAKAGGEAGALFAARMADSVVAASGKLRAAQKAAMDATGTLSVAQTRLNDLQTAGVTSATRLAAAEEGVAKAQRNVEYQTDRVLAAQANLTRTTAASAEASAAAAAGHGLLAGGMGRVTTAGGILTGVLKTVNHAYGLMFAAMTLALPVLPFVAAARDAGNFQSALVKLVTTAGESKSNLKLVGDGLLQMSTEVGIGAVDLAKGMYLIESAGFHGADGLTVMKASAEAARQENADLGKVVDAVTTLLHDYHLPASEAADVTSKLVTAVSHGKVTFEELTGALHSVTPLASALHIPLEDIVSALAGMTASGESAEQATENMRNALMSLQNPSAQQRAELEQLGITVTDLSDDLSSHGLTGTLQLISRTILEQMGPSGRIMLEALNKSQTAANAMKHEVEAMPGPLQKLSQGLLDGSVTVGDYRKAVLGMSATSGSMGLEFLQLYRSSDGFNTILRTGRPDVQTYEQALQKAVGTTAGLSVALQLTGENGIAVDRTILDVANSAAQADGNIRGWDEVQGTFNQKLAEAGASMQALSITIGNGLLPPLGSFLGIVADHIVPTLQTWIGQLGSFVHSSGFQEFLHGIATTAGDLASVIGRLVGAFVSSGGLHDVMVATGGVIKLAAGALEGLAGIATTVLGKLVTGFSALPGPLQAVVAGFAALRIAAASGLFDGLMAGGARLLGFLGTLKTGVQLAALEMATAFRAANTSFTVITDETQVRTVGRMTGAIEGIGAAAGVAARGGLAAFKSAGAGLVSLLGGPWGVAFAGAGILIGLLVTQTQRHNQAVEKATTDVTAWYKAMDSGGTKAVQAHDALRAKMDELATAQAKLKDLQEQTNNVTQETARGAGGLYNAIAGQTVKVNDLNKELRDGRQAYLEYWNSLTPVEQATSRVSGAEADLAKAIHDHGVNSTEAIIAAGAYQRSLSAQKVLTDELNAAEQTTAERLDTIAQKQLAAVNSSLNYQTQELALAQSIADVNKQQEDGTLSAAQLQQQQLQVAQQLLQVAAAAGQAAADQAAANGVTDTAAVKNQAMLDVLRKYADQITGPGHDAIVNAITDLASFQTANENAARGAGDLKAAIDDASGAASYLSGILTGPGLSALNGFGSQFDTTTGQLKVGEIAWRGFGTDTLNGTVIPALTGFDAHLNGPTTQAITNMASTVGTANGVINTSYAGMATDTGVYLSAFDAHLNGPSTSAVVNFASTVGVQNGIVNASFNGMSSNVGVQLTAVQNNLNGPTTTALVNLANSTNTMSTSVMTSFEGMSKGVNRSAVQTVNGVNTAFDKIRVGVAYPVNFVTQNAIGGGLIPAFNNVAAAVGIGGISVALPNVSVPSSAVLSAAGGGEIPGPYRGPTADNVMGYIPMAGGGQTPIRVNPREWIHPVASVDYYGSDIMAALQTRQISRDSLGLAMAMDGMARGGQVASGPDRGDYVVNQSIARGTGRFLDALNAGQSEAIQAAGGWNASPRFFWGGYADPISAAKAFAAAQNAKPYIWGGVGPAGFDCSGYQSAITNVLRGSLNPYSRVGTTATFPWKGFSPGLGGAYAVGAFHGNPGHMAGTLGGVNVESGGPHNDVRYGGPAAGADSSQFNIKAFLPEIGGVFASGGAGGGPSGITVDGQLMTDPGQVLAYLKASVAGRLATMTATYGNNFVTQMGAGTVNTLVSRVYEHIAGTIAAAMSSGGGTVAADGSVKQIVQAQAKPYGWDTGSEWSSIDQIISHESGWNPTAKNPSSTASGLGQFINATWLAYRGSSSAPTMAQAAVGDQGSAIMRYLKGRYGDPNAAWAFWQAHNYYSQGGQVKAGKFDDGGLWPDKWMGLNSTGGYERVLTPPQDQVFTKFARFAEPLMRGDRGSGGDRSPVWHLYLGDREITDLVDSRLEWRDDRLSRDLRSAR